MKELNSFRKYLRISESFNESLSEFIDKSDELSKLPPEDVQGAKDALEQVYNEGNIVSPQNIDQVPNKPGVYFLWMSSEGAKVIDDIVKELGVEDDKQLTGGCTIKSIKGKTYLLVYVGRIYGSLNKRLGDHMARKDFNLSAITTGGDSVFTQKLGSLLSKGGGRDNQYYEKLRNFVDDNMLIQYYVMGEVKAQKGSVERDAINALEKKFIKGCSLYFNDQDVPKAITHTIINRLKGVKNLKGLSKGNTLIDSFGIKYDNLTPEQFNSIVKEFEKQGYEVEKASDKDMVFKNPITLQKVTDVSNKALGLNLKLNKYFGAPPTTLLKYIDKG
jgi:hypothetical protein